MIHIVSLFGLTYANRGLAMIESIKRFDSSSVKFTILAMDDPTFNFLKFSKIENLDVLQFQEFQDFDFQKLVGVRQFKELCWTAASCLTRSIYESDLESDFILYVDSDCYFFADISKMIGKWDKNANIFIHEHRYSPSRIAWESTSGRFNVGVIGFRGNNCEARSCIDRWRLQVLESCELDPDKGLCGDQGYLNEWPLMYPGLQIMMSAGEGAAPWNIEPLQASRNQQQILVDGQELIFYHFHALKLEVNKKLRILCNHLANGYSVPNSFRKFVYRPYLRHLRKVNKKLLSTNFNFSEIGVSEVNAKEIILGGAPKQRLIQLLL